MIYETLFGNLHGWLPATQTTQTLAYGIFLTVSSLLLETPRVVETPIIPTTPTPKLPPTPTQFAAPTCTQLSAPTPLTAHGLSCPWYLITVVVIGLVTPSLILYSKCSQSSSSPSAYSPAPSAKRLSLTLQNLRQASISPKLVAQVLLNALVIVNYIPDIVSLLTFSSAEAREHLASVLFTFALLSATGLCHLFLCILAWFSAPTNSNRIATDYAEQSLKDAHHTTPEPKEEHTPIIVSSFEPCDKQDLLDAEEELEVERLLTKFEPCDDEDLLNEEEELEVEYILTNFEADEEQEILDQGEEEGRAVGRMLLDFDDDSDEDDLRLENLQEEEEELAVAKYLLDIEQDDTFDTPQNADNDHNAFSTEDLGPELAVARKEDPATPSEHKEDDVLVLSDVGDNRAETIDTSPQEIAHAPIPENIAWMELPFPDLDLEESQESNFVSSEASFEESISSFSLAEDKLCALGNSIIDSQDTKVSQDITDVSSNISWSELAFAGVDLDSDLVADEPPEAAEVEVEVADKTAEEVIDDLNVSWSELPFADLHFFAEEESHDGPQEEEIASEVSWSELAFANLTDKEHHDLETDVEDVHASDVSWSEIAFTQPSLADPAEEVNAKEVFVAEEAPEEFPDLTLFDTAYDGPFAYVNDESTIVEPEVIQQEEDSDHQEVIHPAENDTSELLFTYEETSLIDNASSSLEVTDTDALGLFFNTVAASEPEPRLQQDVIPTSAELSWSEMAFERDEQDSQVSESLPSLQEAFSVPGCSSFDISFTIPATPDFSDCHTSTDEMHDIFSPTNTSGTSSDASIEPITPIHTYTSTCGASPSSPIDDPLFTFNDGDLYTEQDTFAGVGLGMDLATELFQAELKSKAPVFTPVDSPSADFSVVLNSEENSLLGDVDVPSRAPSPTLILASPVLVPLPSFKLDTLAPRKEALPVPRPKIRSSILGLLDGPVAARKGSWR